MTLADVAAAFPCPADRLRKAMFYLAKGLRLSIGELMNMEFVEFMHWMSLEVEHNTILEERTKAMTKKAGRK